MKNWLKQIFCSHMYKDEAVQFLTKERVSDGRVSCSYSTYEIYAVFTKCVKCGKTHVKTKRKLVI